MPKISMLNQLIGVFQKKKQPCDDIVTAADKVIEKYIFSKNKLIYRACKPKRDFSSLALWGALFGVVGIVAVMIMNI